MIKLSCDGVPDAARWLRILFQSRVLVIGWEACRGCVFVGLCGCILVVHLEYEGREYYCVFLVGKRAGVIEVNEIP